MNLFLKAERYEEIRCEVANFIEDWGIQFYPFSITELINKMGIQIVPYSSLPEPLRKKVAAYYPNAITLYPKDLSSSETTIFYEGSMSSGRIRFTLAHELAHLALGHPCTGELVYEHEADFFANYLLGPAPLLLKYSMVNTKVIKKTLKVSHSCAESIKDRTYNRLKFGPKKWTEYETRILEGCSLMGGD